MIVFDALNHSYTEDKVSLPSVTTVLKAEGFYDPRVFAEGVANRGTEVHLITQKIDEGLAGPKTYRLHHLYAYTLAWQKFKQDIGAEILQCEIMVGGKEAGCAGTVDRIALIRGQQYVLDIKSGAAMSWHAIQLAGYKCLLNNLSPRRMCVYLKNTGKYTTFVHANRYDETVWKAALISYRWKKENVK
ncbi:hypothetical protein LCGC14_3040300 [marine sediment metagenome]|uniref:PD-(D/E)XK endonuclease-like domain-containing protein n=1 Tax=marine sediment metagenome TaxID=412755 RepID=A0A0F8WPP7_9ZZZZ